MRIDDRELSLSNLDKVLYPQTGTTKGEAIDYYARIAPVMLPHLAGRCITLEAVPQRRRRRRDSSRSAARSIGRRGYRRRSGRVIVTATSATAGSTSRRRSCGRPTWPRWSCMCRWQSPPIWRPPWRWCSTSTLARPAGMKECCEIAMWVRDVLAAVDLEGWCKTSGSKGLQMYVPLNTPCYPRWRRRLRPCRRSGAGTPTS